MLETTAMDMLKEIVTHKTFQEHLLASFDILKKSSPQGYRVKD